MSFMSCLSVLLLFTSTLTALGVVRVDFDTPRRGPLCVVIDSGESVLFQWDEWHNMYQMPNYASYQSCNFGSARQLAPARPNPSVGVTVTPTVESYYACSKICAYYGHKVKICPGADCACPEGRKTDMSTRRRVSPPRRRSTRPPTSRPTRMPTLRRTLSPTKAPTRRPTIALTPKPTLKPTSKPTVKPTPKPTRELTVTPTPEPTFLPTARPTPKSTPGLSPGPIVQPSTMATFLPTPQPTSEPKQVASASPMPTLRKAPTHSPSDKPSAMPAGEAAGPDPTSEQASPTPQPTTVQPNEASSVSQAAPTPTSPPRLTMSPSPAVTALPKVGAVEIDGSLALITQKPDKFIGDSNVRQALALALAETAAVTVDQVRIVAMESQSRRLYEAPSLRRLQVAVNVRFSIECDNKLDGEKVVQLLEQTSLEKMHVNLNAKLSQVGVGFQVLRVGSLVAKVNNAPSGNSHADEASSSNNDRGMPLGVLTVIVLASLVSCIGAVGASTFIVRELGNNAKVHPNSESKQNDLYPPKISGDGSADTLCNGGPTCGGGSEAILKEGRTLMNSTKSNGSDAQSPEHGSQAAVFSDANLIHLQAKSLQQDRVYQKTTARPAAVIRRSDVAERKTSASAMSPASHALGSPSPLTQEGCTLRETAHQGSHDSSHAREVSKSSLAKMPSAGNAGHQALSRLTAEEQERQQQQQQQSGRRAAREIAGRASTGRVPRSSQSDLQHGNSKPTSGRAASAGRVSATTSSSADAGATRRGRSSDGLASVQRQSSNSRTPVRRFAA